MRKTPSACVGGRGVEKQGCRSALHHPSRLLATCISKSFDLFHRKEFNSSRMAAARHYCFSHQRMQQHSVLHCRGLEGIWDSEIPVGDVSIELKCHISFLISSWKKPWLFLLITSLPCICMLHMDTYMSYIHVTHTHTVTHCPSRPRSIALKPTQCCLIHLNSHGEHGKLFVTTIPLLDKNLRALLSPVPAKQPAPKFLEFWLPLVSRETPEL